MNLYVRAFFLTLGANVVALLPFLLFHRVALLEAIGLVAIIAALGPCVQLRAVTRKAIAPERKEEMVIMSALFLPVLVLVLHAVIWSAFHASETGRVLPDSSTHWFAIGVALTGFIAWSFCGLYFYPKRKKPDQSTEPMPPKRRGSA